MRLFLVDPGLVTAHGHHASNDRAMSAAARSLGVEAHVFCNRHADERTLAEMSAIRAFSHSPYAWPSLPANVSLERFFEALRAKADVFRQELSTDVAPHIGPEDVLLAHTVFIPELHGLVGWYGELAPAQRPRLAVMLRFEPEAGFLLADLPDHSKSTFRELVQQLERLGSGGRVVFFTDTPMLTSAYRSITGSQAIRTLPAPLVPRSAPADSSQRYAIAYIGEVSPDKGFRVALEAAGLLSERRPDIRFRFQSGRGAISTEEQARYPNVEFLPGGLSDAEYFALIDSSIAVLALYNPASYRRRSSGSFLDATIGGTMTISSSCSVGVYLEQMGCSFLITRDWTPGAAAEKIEEVYDRRAEYGERFRSASAGFVAYHRADRFVAELVGCFGTSLDAGPNPPER